MKHETCFAAPGTERTERKEVAMTTINNKVGKVGHCSACGKQVQGGLWGQPPQYSAFPFTYCSADCRALWEMEGEVIAFRSEEERKAIKFDEELAARKADERERLERARRFRVAFEEATLESFTEALKKLLRDQVDLGDYRPGIGTYPKDITGIEISIPPYIGGSILVRYFNGRREVGVRDLRVINPAPSGNPYKDERWDWRENINLLEFEIEEIEVGGMVLPPEATPYSRMRENRRMGR